MLQFRCGCSGDRLLSETDLVLVWAKVKLALHNPVISRSSQEAENETAKQHEAQTTNLKAISRMEEPKSKCHSK